MRATEWSRIYGQQSVGTRIEMRLSGLGTNDATAMVLARAQLKWPEETQDSAEYL